MYFNRPAEPFLFFFLVLHPFLIFFWALWLERRSSWVYFVAFFLYYHLAISSSKCCIVGRSRDGRTDSAKERLPFEPYVRIHEF